MKRWFLDSLPVCTRRIIERRTPFHGTYPADRNFLLVVYLGYQVALIEASRELVDATSVWTQRLSTLKKFPGTKYLLIFISLCLSLSLSPSLPLSLAGSLALHANQDACGQDELAVSADEYKAQLEACATTSRVLHVLSSLAGCALEALATDLAKSKAQEEELEAKCKHLEDFREEWGRQGPQPLQPCRRNSMDCVKSSRN